MFAHGALLRGAAAGSQAAPAHCPTGANFILDGLMGVTMSRRGLGHPLVPELPLLEGFVRWHH